MQTEIIKHAKLELVFNGIEQEEQGMVNLFIEIFKIKSKCNGNVPMDKKKMMLLDVLQHVTTWNFFFLCPLIFEFLYSHWSNNFLEDKVCRYLSFCTVIDVGNRQMFEFLYSHWCGVSVDVWVSLQSLTGGIGIVASEGFSKEKLYS